ncbi:peptidoglycan-binding protein LysM [Dyella sp. M7H15-1]|uniref:CIS tube protein n=1 Tax=Dyella sp. M7H15-1 TaxID=2501295 RepID=UPI001005014F|nr:peptidoglycan-binding protein LysM [Dyella sp. M7H15-1]QAU25542.1 peptidoglycan-binding protein LysM [Dyella sp. M7H15-1]
MLEKAKIIVQSSPTKTIPVMYNPTELSLNKTVLAAGEGSNVQFQRVVDDDLTVNLFFDTYDSKSDVRKYTDQIAALTKPTAGTGMRREPPTVVFSWAGALFTGMVVKLEQKFTLFLESGVPVRAELRVTFKSILTPQQDLASRGYANCRQFWTVAENDRLYLIAQHTLGDASLWRLIADANAIYDPLNFPTPADIGKTLVIIDVHGESYNPPARV